MRHVLIPAVWQQRLQPLRVFARAFWRYPAVAAPWLRRARPVIVLLAVVMVAVLLGELLGATAEAERQVSAALLEGAGVLLLMRSLVNARVEFNRPPIRVRVREWWNARPPLRREIRYVTAQGSIHFAALGASGRVVISPGPDATVEQRLSAAERAIQGLEKDLNSYRQDNQRAHDKLRKSFEAEESDRKRLHEALAKQLENTAVGDWDYQAVSAAWIGFGVVFGIWPG